MMSAMAQRLRSHMPKGRARWVLLAALLGLAFLGYQAFFAPSAPEEGALAERKEFVQQVSLSGKVVAAKDVDLGFAASGRVTHVYAPVGSTVAAGALLAEVENGDLRASLAQRQASLASQQAKLDALLAGPRPESVAVAEAAVASAEAARTQARQALVNAINSAYSTADDAVRNKSDQFIQNPRTAWPSLTFTLSDTQAGTKLLNDRVLLETQLRAWEGSALALSTESDLSVAADEAKQNLDATARFLNEANAALNTGIPTTNVPLSTISGYITAVATVRSAVSAAATALTTAQTALRSAETGLASAQKSLALARVGATAEDLSSQRALVRAAQADVDSARAQLGKTLITAPFAGVVTKMDVAVGEVAAMNEPVASMASKGAFQIEGYVPEINVALVRVGAAATVTLDAYGDNEVFDATVISLDPAETVRDGVSTYKVVLQFGKMDDRIRSGMTADMTIAATRRPDVLLIPRGMVYEKDGASYVLVKEGDTQTERAVETGDTSSFGDIEIVSGLTEGDRVVPRE
ncbi:efflux RND transporter periplasmic adaptor subunit [Candidatus Kaiserbacteria bacterium]|nr:efflux RND transporter periplasmic adaptor subunit [Candidatus Kaiserbacteria bacterium]